MRMIPSWPELQETENWYYSHSRMVDAQYKACLQKLFDINEKLKEVGFESPEYFDLIGYFNKYLHMCDLYNAYLNGLCAQRHEMINENLRSNYRYDG